jgi:ABC-type nitrate/sulfonate/bicarbonate transport system substrate-binding protein
MAARLLAANAAGAAPLLSSPNLTDHAAHLRIGYLPLSDAAPLIVAQAKGLFARHGIRVSLHPTSAWAGLRDRLLFGALDAAHLLYPMPIAAAIGLGQAPRALVAACGLGRNGNTITLSAEIAAELGLVAPPVDSTAFAALARRRLASDRKLRLAAVHAYSTHSYLLRQWLADNGLNPDSDVDLLVVPPPLVAQQLAAGQIDGFCAGEPWGSHAVLTSGARVALGSGMIWADHPEKLLVVTADLVAREEELAIAASAAVIEAARWLDDAGNREETVALMAPLFPGLDRHAVAGAHAGTVPVPGGDTYRLRYPLRFGAATRPDPAEAAAWLGQMRRWGHVPAGTPDATALAPFDNTLWAAAAARLGETLPALSPSQPEA